MGCAAPAAHAERAERPAAGDPLAGDCGRRLERGASAARVWLVKEQSSHVACAQPAPRAPSRPRGARTVAGRLFRGAALLRVAARREPASREALHLRLGRLAAPEAPEQRRRALGTSQQPQGARRLLARHVLRHGPAWKCTASGPARPPRLKKSQNQPTAQKRADFRQIQGQPFQSQGERLFRSRNARPNGVVGAAGTPQLHPPRARDGASFMNDESSTASVSQPCFDGSRSRGERDAKFARNTRPPGICGASARDRDAVHLLQCHCVQWSCACGVRS